jgi:hypothetical protein
LAHYFLVADREGSFSDKKAFSLGDPTPPPPRHVQQAVLVGGVSEEKMAWFYAASTLLHAED